MISCSANFPRPSRTATINSMKVVISRGFIRLFRLLYMRCGVETRIAEMAVWQRAIELSLTDTDKAKLRSIA